MELNNTFLITTVSRRNWETRKYFKMNLNENTTYQNLRDVSKAVLRGKLRVVIPVLRTKHHKPIA